jgi:hypothetical protein
MKLIGFMSFITDVQRYKHEMAGMIRSFRTPKLTMLMHQKHQELVFIAFIIITKRGHC